MCPYDEIISNLGWLEVKSKSQPWQINNLNGKNVLVVVASLSQMFLQFFTLRCMGEETVGYQVSFPQNII